MLGFVSPLSLDLEFVPATSEGDDETCDCKVVQSLC